MLVKMSKDQNCKELILLPELFGEGGRGSSIFMYIYDDFNNKSYLDINKIFADDVKKKFVVFDINKHDDSLNKIDDKINDKINDEEFYIIMPMGFGVKNDEMRHAVTVIYEFHRSILEHVHILNSGEGVIGYHHVYNDKYVNYVYTIDIGYKFDKFNKNNKSDMIILKFLLTTLFKKILYIADLYY